MTPALATAAPPLARRLYQRSDTRSLDLLDVALANEMLRIAQREALAVRPEGRKLARVVATREQAEALEAVAGCTTPRSMEAWMRCLAPRLARDVVALVGDGWTAEVELSVELALALRADDMRDFAAQLTRGPVTLDSARRAAEIVAADVPDPALIYFV